MKLFDIVSAYHATNELSEIKDLSPADQWSIYKFRKDAKVQFDFYSEKMDEIKSKYNKYADESGNITDNKIIEEYVKEVEEINNIDVDFTSEKKTIKLVNGISFLLIEKLDEFFEFIV